MVHTADRRAPRFLALVLPLLAAAPAARAQTFTVSPVVETGPVPTGGDAADDMAIWVHPLFPALSLVIGTDKDSGLLTYDLSGNQIQYLPDGSLNNVDIRYGFPLGLLKVALVTSGERDFDRLAIYAVEPTTRTLLNVAAGPIPLNFSVYGCCMYKSPVTKEFYFFGTSDGGTIKQFRLFEAPGGGVDAQEVRSFDAGGTIEGCVADDESGFLFLSEENVGIHRYGAEPGAGTANFLVDTTGAGGNLTADVEGLTIYYTAGGGGYLIASSQGSNTYVVYQRAAPHAYLTTFQIGANAALGIDGTTETDGIDVTNLGLGSAFPDGVFIAQDDSNPGFNQNFKLVEWQDIASGASPPLAVDNSYDAYGTGCPASATLRNGSGANPAILANLAQPILGSTWSSSLNCAGVSPGPAYLLGFSLPSSGFFYPFGEVLVDLSSANFVLLATSHTGNVVPFSVAIPPQLLLCGLEISLQGACFGASGATLSNAIDLVIGF
jgi:myo-inositol-hexaphosphate 3-phosphohydrolase